MKKIYKLLGVLTSIFALQLPQVSDAREFVLKVGRSSGSAIPSAKVSEVVSYMNAIFSGGYTGVDCDVSFRMTSNSIVTAPDTVKDQRALNNLLFDSNNNVIVVRFLNWCGKYSPTWSGCSDDNLNIVVDSEVSTNTNIGLQTNAVLWLHEFGHSQKLSHTSSDNNMMEANVNAANLILTGAQCTNFERENLRFRSGQGTIVDGIVGVQDIVTSIGPLDLLLSSIWNTIPVNDIREIIPDPAPLRSLLMDPSRTELWPNGIFALGVVGAASDIDFLYYLYQNYAELADGEYADESAVRARTNISVAISMIGGNVNAEEKAYETILKILNENRGEAGRARIDPVADDQLITNAIFGIAALPSSNVENLLGQAASIDGYEFEAETISSVIDSAIQAREQGLIEYLSSPAPQ